MALLLPPPPKRAKTNAVDAANVSTAFISDLQEQRIQVSTSIMLFDFNKKRVRVLTASQTVPEYAKGVVYWMSRDQRVQDNWAMLYSQRLAIKNRLPLHVVFCLVPKFLDATIRHYNFLLKGLEQLETECTELNISFHVLFGEAVTVLPRFISDRKIGALVSDFSPLRGPRSWVAAVTKALPPGVPHCEVDAHNIVPCWVASDKLEYSARTIRNKINNKLPEFLTEFPPVVEHPVDPPSQPERVDWVAAEKSLQVDRTVKPVTWATPGTAAGLTMLHTFCTKRLSLFGDMRNDPTVDALSNLSPWLHYGQISAQRAVLCVRKTKANLVSINSFCEEVIVRRELSDNFCYYNPRYDSVEGTNSWAKQSLKIHAKDQREYLYTREEWENSRTHDDLWNSAQIQLVREGKMHGFLRMYWAKKILEWSESPEQALATAIYLNDRHSLDGRDPSGFVGCMWSICGIHDQGWAERAVFGKIRYMNYQGCMRKFKITAFIARYGGKVHVKAKAKTGDKTAAKAKGKPREKAAVDSVASTSKKSSPKKAAKTTAKTPPKTAQTKEQATTKAKSAEKIPVEASGTGTRKTARKPAAKK